MNYKLAVKVLKEMEDDFIKLEATLLQIRDEQTQIILFKEIREHRQAVALLFTHYVKVLRRGGQDG